MHKQATNLERTRDSVNCIFKLVFSCKIDRAKQKLLYVITVFIGKRRVFLFCGDSEISQGKCKCPLCFLSINFIDHLSNCINLKNMNSQDYEPSPFLFMAT